ncbi:MAG: hypothetical protein ACM3QS_18135 [Bacteroidota bacterium]
MITVYCSLALLLASCASLVPPVPASTPAGLYVYRLDPPALLQLADDHGSVASEIPLPPPGGCSASEFHPSPRGDRLALEYACQNGPLSVLVSLSDGAPRPLIDDPAVDSHFLAWAADGRSVYLRIDSLNNPRIQRVDVKTLKPADIPIDPYTYDLAPAPDGKHILFSISHGIGLGSETWLARADGRGAKLLFSDPQGITGYARWSPDGTQIAFIKIPDSQTPYSIGELSLVEADGSNPRKLSDADAGHGYAPAWSPDGQRLAFVVRSNPDDPHADGSLDALVSNIAIVEVSSGTVSQVTHFTRGRAETPIWSPDGNSLQFNTVLDGRMEVQSADLRAGTSSPVLQEAVCCPVWMRK